MGLGGIVAVVGTLGGSASMDENTDAGRRNREAILDQADAIIDAVRADYERDGSMTNLVTKYDEQIGKLRDTMTQFGISETAADEYIATLGLTPEQVLTQVVAETGNASSAILAFIGLTGQIPRFTHTTVNVAVNDAALRDVNRRIAQSGGTVMLQHDGGWAGSGTLRSAAAGIGPDEIPAVLKSGEFVVRDDVARQYGPLLEQLNARRFHDGGWVGRDMPLGQANATATASAQPASVTIAPVIHGNPDQQTIREGIHQARLYYLRNMR
jgi:hypothetical protein